MRWSTWNFNIPSPPLPQGKAWAFELLKTGSFKFSPPRAKGVFKCATQSLNFSARSRRWRDCSCSRLRRQKKKFIWNLPVSIHFSPPFWDKGQISHSPGKESNQMSEICQGRGNVEVSSWPANNFECVGGINFDGVGELTSVSLMNASHSTNLFTNSCDHIFTDGKAPLHSHINHNNPQFLYSLWRRANARHVSFLNLSRW